ncbi:ComEC/Rec2 family competence protein [Aquipuribacter sp. MA13-6]|uniref:ComEC/Rec2 family competence protein n=1 Tax=unclassified Aquipuribacter TaxID=2635084 RepID=UPI003EEF0D9B
MTAAGAPRAVHDVRLVPAALLAWGAAWWAVAAPPAAGRSAAVAVLGVGLLAVAGLLARRPRLREGAGVVAVAAALVALVLGLTSWHGERRAPPVVVDVAARSGTALVELVVAGDPVRGSGEMAWQREQVRLRVVLVEVVAPGSRGDPAEPVALRVPASLSGDQAWASARWGERVRVRLALEAAPPGAPYTVFARPAGPVQVVGEPRWWWRAAERLRSGLLLASTGAEVGPGAAAGPGAVLGPAAPPGSVARDGPLADGAVLLPGLVVGDTSAQPADLVDDMRAAGLTHLTAVSGANVSIVCGGVLLLCVLLRVGRRGGVLLAAVALVALVVVARPEPSVLRAAVMGSVGLAGLLLGRRGGGVSALALAVVAVLLVDPWLSRAPGFRLSVLATGALVLCSLPWARALGRVLPRSPALVLAVPAAAQAAVTPALVGLEPVVSLYALPANVLAAPAVAPATVIGVVAALLSLVHPAVAALVATPARWCAAWIAVVARTSADLPAATLPWPEGRPGVAGAAGATVLLLGLVALVLRLLPDRRGGRAWAPWPDPRTWAPATPERPGPSRAPEPAAGPGWRRGPVGVAAALTVVVLALAAALPLPGRSSWPGTDWAVVVCDVGQGESLLVRVGPASAVVVDTGPDPEPMGRCLRRAGVTSVPLLVLTHLHADHVGGLDGVVATAAVGTVWAAGSGMPEAPGAELQAWVSRHGLPLRHPARGTVVRVGDVRLDVLSPDPRPSGATAGDSQDVNDAGIVLRLDTGDLTLLAVGDIGSDVQRRLLGSGTPLRADVTTVAHHGSADQLPEFYAAVAPGVAVASAGRDNSYGHPSLRAVQVVGATGALVLATATHGDVALRPAGGPGAAGASPGTGGSTEPAHPATVAVRTTRAGPRRPRRRRPVPA